MIPAIKFCGITRVTDARHAARLGAAFVGVILTDGPRRVSPERARAIYLAAGNGVTGVAVFRDETVDEMLRATAQCGASILQMHRSLGVDELHDLRAAFEGEVWTVVGVSADVESSLRALDSQPLGDGLLIDSSIGEKSGGTGRPIDWGAVAAKVEASRGERRLILAGGLTPLNVGAAVAALRPDVVDVSSGVETAPGIKDPALMERFALAVAAASADLASSQAPKVAQR